MLVVCYLNTKHFYFTHWIICMYVHMVLYQPKSPCLHLPSVWIFNNKNVSTYGPTHHHAYTATLFFWRVCLFVKYKNVFENNWSKVIPLGCRMCNLNLQCFVQPLLIVHPIIWLAMWTDMVRLTMFLFNSFQNLGIQCVRRREVRDAIMQRVNRGLNPFSGKISFRFLWCFPLLSCILL